MKTITLILFLTTLTATAQTIRIADNNPNRPTGANIYSTIKAAQDAAVAGDIVFVQPSLTSYGDVTIDRPITLRGIGFNTGKDLAYQSVLNNIRLTNTVTNTTNASGSIIEGISANAVLLGFRTGSFSFSLQNITIQNCYLNYIYRDDGTSLPYLATNNVIIRNCEIGVLNFAGGPATTQFLVYGNRFFAQGIAVTFTVTLPGTTHPNGGSNFFSRSTSISSYIISNNIFSINSGIDLGGISGNANNTFTTASSVLVTNNVFLGNPGIGNTFGWITDFSFNNNIFYGFQPRPSNVTIAAFGRNAFNNNVTFNVADPLLPPLNSGTNTNTGSGNLQNTNPLFTNVPVNTNWSSSLDFRLQASSPAKNAGTDGTDIGITGGAYPVTNGNIQLVPTTAPVILQFNPAAMVPQNQPVKANIKAKAN